ncbi:MAG: DUF3105 domain-containing protein [Myxococcota bacterium]
MNALTIGLCGAMLALWAGCEVAELAAAPDVVARDAHDADVGGDGAEVVGDATVTDATTADSVDGSDSVVPDATTDAADVVADVPSDATLDGALPDDTLVEDTSTDDTSTSSDDTSTSADDTSTDDADSGDDALACSTVVTTYPVDPSPHVAVCSAVTYSSNPPTSGPHYPIWAQFKVYSEAVPRGYYVHDLEHGAVVVAYNCPEGCADDVAALVAFMAARPADPLCALQTAPNRFVVTPDPLLDTRFAATAWGVALTSDCFDLTALGAFLDANYGHGPEAFCSDGVDVTVPGLGTYCPP